MRIVTVSLLLALSACTFDARGPSRFQGDVGAPLDSNTLRDGNSDVLGTDGQAAADGISADGADARADLDDRPDGSAVDQRADGTIDSHSPDSSIDLAVDGGPPSCNELFGSGSSYQFCDEDASSCTYYVALGQTSCGAFCSGHGLTCLRSHDEGPDGDLCNGLTTERDCVSTSNDRLCVCAKP